MRVCIHDCATGEMRGEGSEIVWEWDAWWGRG